MGWLQISLQIEGADADEAAEALEILGAVAVTLEDAEDSPLLEPAPGETPLWPHVIVTGLFGADDPQRFFALQENAVWGLRKGFHLSRVLERAWEREWLKDFHPMRFGRHLWVCPGDQPPPGHDDQAITLKLDPGLAFGTGTHPTTALCLEWLEARRPVGLRVVDFGCGSGILAIAAALLGAQSVHALDIDPQALSATINNARRNEVDQKIRVSAASGPIPDCDLVVSNILAGPLMELAPVFARALQAGAGIVLSGILAGQADAVADAFGPWFHIDDRTERDGWVCLAGHRLETD